MRNLNGYLKKTLLISSILFAFIFLGLNFTNKANALDGFDIKSDYNHIWDGKKIDSTVYITISTTQSPRVITYYTITIPEENLKPEIYSLNKNIKLEPTYYNRSGATDIVVDLENTVVSSDKPVFLKMTFSTESSKDSLSLISSINDSKSRSFTFTYPSKYGDISWSSTPVTKVTQKGENIEVQTASPQGKKVNISLGKKIVYEFHISRNLLNSSDEMISSEISLPPNTNMQKISIDSIQPQPDKTYKDIDGNYILQYEIAPQSNIEVAITGYIEMGKTIYSDIQIPNIETETLWQIKDTDLEKRISKYIKDSLNQEVGSIYDIKDTAKQEILYRSLYRFVVDNLEPNTLTIGSLSGTARLGGERALGQQAKSTSEDYADAAISIFRKYKIPARLVIGYVTNISDYHPDGMYHYWIEYMDVNKKDWIVIDPFLEDYSNTSLWGRTLVDHVTLLYRYENPNTPKLPYYSENDFQISINKENIEQIYDISADIYIKPFKFVDSHLQGSINVKNNGNTVIDMIDITKSNPDIKSYLDHIENNSTILLLPNDTTEIKFNIPSIKIDTPIYAVIKAYSGSETVDEKYVETNIELTNSTTYLKIFTKISSILLFVVIVLPIYIIYRKKHIKHG